MNFDFFPRFFGGVEWDQSPLDEAVDLHQEACNACSVLSPCLCLSYVKTDQLVQALSVF